MWKLIRILALKDYPHVVEVNIDQTGKHCVLRGLPIFFKTFDDAVEFVYKIMAYTTVQQARKNGWSVLNNGRMGNYISFKIYDTNKTDFITEPEFNKLPPELQL